MTEVRPDEETVPLLGAEVRIAGAAGLLAAAVDGPVELLVDGDFPAPVREMRCTVRADAADGQPVHRFEAYLRVENTPADLLALGLAGPVGVLLAERLAARGGDGPAAAVGRIAAEAGRRIWPRPVATLAAPPGDEAGREVLRTAREAGLRPRVDQANGTVRIRADVPSAEVGPAHLHAVLGLLLQAVRELSGDSDEPTVLRGRTYLVGRRPVTAAGPRSAAVTLDQVGGLSDVVARFREVAVSFRHPAAMARWGARRPQGILMYGPPGTGKTMLARALANEVGADFVEIRTPEILDKYLGGSERNIKRIFREARRYRRPTVMLFDEFDSIISYAGAGGDAASQAVNAVAGIFKQEMNTLFEENPDVIVVATTNFPQRVDASLIRSGRFDLKIAIPAPDENGRAEILTKMVRELIERHERPGFKMFADDLDPAALAADTAGLTGADLREALRRVQLAKALREAAEGAPPAPIGQDDLREAVAGLRRG
ncbi:ATP-binding protein [Micromonospora sp. NPDC048887]|uniref:ATP-binding protein n=1 Tax=unclassified Micromonospora TaxID=2617518 RepID=UPI0033E538C0